MSEALEGTLDKGHPQLCVVQITPVLRCMPGPGTHTVLTYQNKQTMAGKQHHNYYRLTTIMPKQKYLLITEELQASFPEFRIT